MLSHNKSAQHAAEQQEHNSDCAVSESDLHRSQPETALVQRVEHKRRCYLVKLRLAEPVQQNERKAQKYALLCEERLEQLAQLLNAETALHVLRRIWQHEVMV